MLCRIKSLLSIISHRSVTSSSGAELVLSTIHENYSILTLNKPKVNTLDPAMLLAIQRKLKEVESNEKMRGVIITGLPGVFSAGLDLPVLSQYNREEMNDFLYLLNETLGMMALSRLISITAISGHAPAGGTVLALTSDYRIASAGSYRLGLNEVQVGIVVPPFILSLLHDVVGPRHAQHLALTGKLMSPVEAHAIGLVDEVVACNDLLPRSQQVLTNWLNSTTSGAVTGTKKLVRSHIQDAFEKLRQQQAHDWLDRWFSDETQERINLFNVKLKAKNESKE